MVQDISRLRQFHHIPINFPAVGLFTVSYSTMLSVSWNLFWDWYNFVIHVLENVRQFVFKLCFLYVVLPEPKIVFESDVIIHKIFLKKRVSYFFMYSWWKKRATCYCFVLYIQRRVVVDFSLLIWLFVKLVIRCCYVRWNDVMTYSLLICAPYFDNSLSSSHSVLSNGCRPT